VGEVLQRRPGRQQLGRREGAQRVERGGEHEQDREEAERHRQHPDDVPPAHLGEPATPGSALRGAAGDGDFRIGGHEYTSSCCRVRRKLIADTVATIAKMKIETAAASPNSAPWAPKANR